MRYWAQLIWDLKLIALILLNHEDLSSLKIILRGLCASSRLRFRLALIFLSLKKYKLFGQKMLVLKLFCFLTVIKVLISDLGCSDLISKFAFISCMMIVLIYKIFIIKLQDYQSYSQFSFENSILYNLKIKFYLYYVT